MSETEVVQHENATPARTEAMTPDRMLMVAVEKGASMEQLERLMDLQQRWEANEARKAFVVALNQFKALPPRLTKDRTVQAGPAQYSHASLAHACDVIGGALSRHGLSHRWEVRQEAGAVSVTCVLQHEQGHSESVTMTAPPDDSGRKNGIQQIGSTATYLQRYTLLAITGLAASDQDDDGAAAGSDVLDDEMAAELKDMVRETGTDTTRFLAFLAAKAKREIPSIDAIPMSLYGAARSALAAKQRKAQTDA